MTQVWRDEVSERLRASLIEARGERSAQDIADETERLGCPVSRSVIANFENGRKRTLDVCELMALAAALQVPPVAMLFPALPDGEVEILPGVRGSSWDGVQWFTGEVDPHVDEDGGGSTLGRVLALTRDRAAAEAERDSAQAGLNALARSRGDDDSGVTEWVHRLVLSAANYTERIEKINRRIALIGGTVKKSRKGKRR